MEPLGVARRPTSILAAGIVGYSRFVSAEEAGMPFAFADAFDLIHEGENVRSLVVLTEPKWLVRSNN